MSCFGYPTNILMLLIVFFSSCIVVSSLNSEQLKELCSKNRDPPYCFAVLNADRRIPYTDDYGACFIVAGIVSTDLSFGRGMIGAYIKNTTNPNLKRVYGLCSEYYEQSISSLGEVRKLLDHNVTLPLPDPYLVRGFAQDARGRVELCGKEFRTPANIPKWAITLEALVSIVVTVANHLQPLK